MIALELPTLRFKLSIDSEIFDIDSFFEGSKLKNFTKYPGLKYPIITKNGRRNDFAIMYTNVEYQYYFFLRSSIDSEKSPFASLELRKDVDFCHFNWKYKNKVCFKSKNNVLSVYEFSETTSSTSSPMQPILLERYTKLNMNKSISYENAQGHDIFLFHHEYNWIYVLDTDEHSRATYALRTYQLFVPKEWNFERFLFVDDFGIISEYSHSKNSSLIRQYYSIRSEKSGLKSYCLHSGKIDGTIGIFAQKAMPPQTPTAEKLIQLKKDLESGGITTSITILYICTVIYLLFFICYTFIPPKKRFITNELLSMEREVTRLSPVIEPVIIGVHEFMNGELAKDALKQKKDN
ncbi:unnamed protein product [Caenorhabditis angaria]|uniref:Uncharacterized protein n=1 Tax=Caenorhabditis angaria TaxID=860376 RepID=A0A9P1MZS7_9PELO|nr:unnamed protein product [Caenorhabditis angaria]